jgi:hypothetical protein
MAINETTNREYVQKGSHKNALQLLAKIKEKRKGKKFKLVRIDHKTFKEIEIND